MAGEKDHSEFRVNYPFRATEMHCNNAQYSGIKIRAEASLASFYAALD
jgi:hypothetical protein